MTRLLVATTNPGKLREIRLIVADLAVQILSLEAYPEVPPAEETGQTFAENARAKALYYAAATGLLTVAEDSGLEIDALGGAPGVYSARYGLPHAVDYPQKFELIYRQLRERGAASSTARFVCALAVASGRSVAFEARGAVEGVIIFSPRGEGGFGYDPILYYPPLGRTLAELSEQEKAVISHRGQAFRALAAFLGRSETLTSG
jgi:XTP/dITP diphosphohydrolase